MWDLDLGWRLLSGKEKLKVIHINFKANLLGNYNIIIEPEYFTANFHDLIKFVCTVMQREDTIAAHSQPNALSLESLGMVNTAFQYPIPI